MPKLRRQRLNGSAAVQSDVRDACWRELPKKALSHICGLKPRNRSSFSSKTFSKCRARSCHSASRKSGKPSATKSIRAISHFRSREFEQMELEYFCRPEQGMELLEYWKEERLKFYENIGIPRANLHVLNVPDEERAFYSKGHLRHRIRFSVWPPGTRRCGVSDRLRFVAASESERQIARVFRRGDEAEIYPARRRAERRRRSQLCSR